MANHHRYMGIGLSALFGVTALLFFGIGYPHHLHQREQLQLFLFTPGYFIDTASIPGGLGDYVGRFLTQFYYHAWAGAAILASLLVVVQRLVWGLAKKIRLRWAFYPLTFLPSIALWASYCDANRTLSLFIACAASLLAARLYLCFGNIASRLLFGTIVMPVLYWAVGSAYFIFVGLVILFEGLRAAEEHAWFRWFVVFAGGAALAFFYPWAAQAWSRYQLDRLLLGINYYRIVLGGLAAQLAVVILAAIIPLAFRFLPELKRKKVFYAVLTLELLLITAGGYFVLWFSADPAKEEAFAYDYYVRVGNWARVLEMADNKPPLAAKQIACLNLALAKTGCMSEKMFNYYQDGEKGLLTRPEAGYQLGMINAAEQVAFDMMESADDFQKSGRHVKRLAEVNLINGQYEVAAKYLRVLQHTLFYRTWADKTMSLLGDEDGINAHPEYGWLRQIREPRDSLWPLEPTFDNAQEMLERLVRNNGKNRLAYEYLLASALLSKKPEQFLQFYPLGKDLRYDHIPIVYQEALSLAWIKEHRSFEGLPWAIDGGVLQRLRRFLTATERYPADQLRGSFGNTYWYYYWFYSEQPKNSGQPKKNSEQQKR